MQTLAEGVGVPLAVGMAGVLVLAFLAFRFYRGTLDRALSGGRVPPERISLAEDASLSAGHAMGIDPRDLVTALKGLFARHKPFKDYTLPRVSLLKGRRLERMLSEQLGDVQIEDLWTGCFCVALDLTAAEAWVHTSGSLLAAVLSSISLPGVFPPVILKDRLLVDGGVVNNLSGDVMRAKCRGTLIAVDVVPTRDVEVPRAAPCTLRPGRSSGRNCCPETAAPSFPPSRTSCSAPPCRGAFRGSTP